MNAIALECDEITKRFPIIDPRSLLRLLLRGSAGEHSIAALRGVSLRVPKGSMIGILGRNGAGKSTLLRVLAGVYEPTSGTVRVNGEIGSLFELGGLGGRFITGREYARRMLSLRGVRGKRRQELVEQVRSFSELEDSFERRIYTYSAGMAARLYFSVATAEQQDVYLIDEILSVGDEHFQAKCWRRMRERLLHGASGVLVTHDWAAVIRLCAQSHVLDSGSITHHGPSDHVVAAYLRIPRPDGALASFEDLPQTIHGSCGEDFEVSIRVRVKQPGPVDFAFSIEALRLGLGWEIMFLSRFEAVSTEPGRFRVKLRVPRLPLSAGTYSLNLFLRKRGAPDTGPVVCDQRSWTLGNALDFVVAGEAQAAIARLPLVWRSGADSNVAY